jgi:hypothetical protein
MPRAISAHDRAEFERLGRDEVRRLLSVSTPWLDAKRQEALAWLDEPQAEESALKREALSISRDQRDIARSALRNSRRANRIAISAMIIGIVWPIIWPFIRAYLANTWNIKLP